LIDSSSNPPHLYISNPLNNRVVGFTDYRKVNAGVKADLVISQPDLITGMVNYPSSNPSQTSNEGLWSTEGLAVDPGGNLYVADACNGRVLRFPTPSNQPAGAMQQANLVLGQTSFFGQSIKDLSRQTMRSLRFGTHRCGPTGGVRRALESRAFFFEKPARGDFQSGRPAANVFGQADFVSSTTAVFSVPLLIAIYPGDQLYVAHAAHNRVAVLPNVPTGGTIRGSSSQSPGLECNRRYREWRKVRDFGREFGRESSARVFPAYQTYLSNPSLKAALSVFGRGLWGVRLFREPNSRRSVDKSIIVLLPDGRIYNVRWWRRGSAIW